MTVQGIDFDGNPTTISLQESFSDIGITTLRPPPWIQTATDQATRMSPKIPESRAYIELTVDHGLAIPGGSEYSVYLENNYLNEIIEEELEVAESLYIYETQAGNLTLTPHRPSPAMIGSPVPTTIQSMYITIFHPEYGTVYADSLSVSADE